MESLIRSKAFGPIKLTAATEKMVVFSIKYDEAFYE